MPSFRLGLFPWLIVTGALSAGQLWALSEKMGTDPSTAALGVLLLQIAKLPATIGRLSDLGRSSDDAVLGLLPLVNIGLWYQLLAGTPKEEIRRKRLADWQNEPTAMASLAWAAGVLGRMAPLALVVAVVAGGAHTWAIYAISAWADAMARAGQAAVAGPQQLFGLIAGLTLLYTLIQYAKRETASRVSWLPSVLLLPALIGWAGCYFAVGGGPIPVVMLGLAFDVLWMCVAGAFVAALFVGAGSAARLGLPAHLGAFDGARRHGVELIAPHAGAEVAVTIGLQVVIPGIHYMLQYAFVDQAAFHEPEKAALRRSTELSRGIRRRLFAVIAVGFLLAYGVKIPYTLLTDGGDVLAQAVMIPTALSKTTYFAWDVISVLSAGLVELAFVHQYFARRASLDAPVKAA